MKRRYFLSILMMFPFLLSAQTKNISEKDTASYPYWIEMMQDQSINFYKIQKAFEVYWDGRKRSKGDGWKVFKRWEAYWEARVDQDGNFPSATQVLNAYQQIASAPLTSQNGSWNAIGPISVPSNGSGQPNGIGRVNSLTVNPTNINEIWAGTPSGGLWKSTNAGSSWVSLTDNLPTLGVSDVLIDSANTSIMYMATGDRDAGDAPGMGVWKSTNAGTTWTVSNTGMGNRTVGKLIMNPSNHSVILAATNNGVYRTTNAGSSWTKTSITANFKDIKFNPSNPNIVYATASGDFYRSTNGGTSFTQITSGVPTTGQRLVIGVSPANASYVYIVVGNSSGLVGVYRSTNSGLTFTTQGTSPNILGYNISGNDNGSQAWYDLDIAVDPSNINILYVGGVNIWKSTNGGSTWSITAHWIGNATVPAVHADQHALVFANGTSKLYAGCDGGLYFTTNGGSSWTDVSSGLAISQLYKFSQSATNSNRIITGFQDNGTAIWSGTNSWSTEIGGDGMNCIIDPTSTTYMYGALYYGDIRRSTNGGSSFGTIAKNGVNGINESGAWVTPYTLQSDNPSTMYVGYKNVWRSTNVKVTGNNNISWTKISNFGSTSTLRVIESSLANANILYVGRGTVLYRSDNIQAATPTWTTLSMSGTIHDIETDPQNANNVYVAAGNNVFKSTNKGVSWVAITGNIPNVSVNTIVFDTSKAEALYVGTDAGVYYKEVGMSTWVNFSNGLPVSAEVTDLEIYYGTAISQNKLRASTYGRSMWSSDLYAPANVPPVADFSAESQLVCMGGSTIFTDLSANQPTSWTWTVTPSTHSFIASTNAASQNPVIKFTATGNYTVQLIASNAFGTDTMIKNAYITVGTPTAVPFTESFETFTTGNPGTWTHGWTFSNTGVFNWRANAGGTASANTGPVVDHTLGTNLGKYLYTEASSPAVTGEVANMISPCIAIPSSGNISMSFWYHMYGSYITGLHVDILHNGIWVNDIYTLIGQQQISNTASWLNAVVPLSSYLGSTVKFRFRVIRGVGYDGYMGDVAIDDFFVGVSGIPSADFTSASTTICAGGSLNFVDASANSPTSWAWSASPSTISFVNSTTSNSQHPTIKFNASGSYSITLIASNSAGSDTITKVNYIIASTAMNLPFSENFESFTVGTPGTLGNSWSSSTVGGNFPWTVDNGGTPTTNSGPSVDHTLGTITGKYLFTEASSPALQGYIANLLTPCINLSTATSGARLKFWYHMYGADITGLHVDVYYNGVWINNVHFINGPQQTSSTAAWQQAVVSLNNYTSSTVKIRFRVVRGASYNGDVAIDDVQIEAITPPANDEPCGSILLTADTICNYLTTNNNDATISSGISAPGCGGTVYQDVWFKVVAPISGGLVINGGQVVGSFADGALAAYSGTCSNLSLLGCNDDFGGSGTMPHLALSGLTPGDTVYIRFWKYGGGTGSFKICVYEPPYFLLSPSTVSIGSAAGSSNISASANSSTAWSVTDNASWLTLTPASGSGNTTIVLNYSANAGGSRTATITGTSAGLPNQTVIVNQISNVVANFTLINPYICSGTNVTFTNTSVNANSYKWYVDGIQVSTQTNYSQIFNTQGTFVIKLVAFGTIVNDSISKFIFVSNAPSANAGVDTSLCEGNSLSFNPSISTGIITCISGCSMPATCLSASNNDNFEYINKVVLNGSTNTSDNSGAGYQNFTQSVLTPLLKDSTYTIQITGFTTASYKEYVDVFIDWNRNGLFDEPAISMGSATFFGAHVFNGIVTVPSNAVIGKTKMRAILKYNAAITGGCENASYGETEDYVIEVMKIDTLNYSWTGPSSYTSNLVNPSVFNIALSQNGTYNLTVTNGFGCSDTSSKVITVIPKPNAGFASISDVCISASSFNLTQGSPAGGSYSGTGVSGSTFSPAIAGVGTHWITYSVTNASGCTDTAMQSIIVNALPVVSFTGLPSNVCQGAPSVMLTGNPSGGTFTGNGIINSNEFDATTAGVGSQSITYSYTDANACSNTAVQSVNVNANPNVFAGNDTTVNYGTSAQLHATSSGTGSLSYAWTPANMVISSTSASTATISMTASQQFNVLITNNTTTCSDSDQVMVSVSGGPLSVVTTVSTDTICEGDSIQLLATATGGPGAYTYSWISSPSGFSSNLMNPWASPNVNTDYIVTVTSGSGPSASSITDTVSVVVNILPNVSLVAFNDLCEGPDTIVLSGGLPLGGIYSGLGVVNGMFYPQIAGVGTHTITYSFSNANGCSAMATQTITINANPTVSLANFTPVCGSSTSFIMTQGSPYGGSYSGAGVSGATFDPSVAGVGMHIIIYSFTDANGCSDNDTNTITVSSSPLANAGVDQLINSGGSATLVGTATGGSSSYTYAWTPTNLLINATNASTTTTSLTSSQLFNFKVIDSQTSCSDSDQVLVTVKGGPLSAVINVGKSPICFGDSTTLTALGSGGTGNYTYSWISSPAGFISSLQSPVVYPITTTAYVLTLSDGVDTVTASSQFVIVDMLPIITLPEDTSVCQTASITLDAGAGYAAYTWSDGSTQQMNLVDANNLPLGITTYYVTVTNTLGCSAFDSIAVDVVVPPNVDLGADTSVCKNGAIILDAGTGYTQYLWSTGATSQTIAVDGSLGVGVYAYWVQAWSANDCYGSDTVEVSVKNCDAIIENNNDYSIIVYPNPSDGLLNIDIKGQQNDVFNLSIYNIQGQLVYQRKIDYSTNHKLVKVDLRHLAKGVYTLRLNGKYINRTEKMVFQ